MADDIWTAERINRAVGLGGEHLDLAPYAFRQIDRHNFFSGTRGLLLARNGCPGCGGVFRDNGRSRMAFKSLEARAFGHNKISVKRLIR